MSPALLLRVPAALCLAACLALAPARAEPPAFPGAEGFGAQATGGRGGRVIAVTTLAAEGPGSLQWAIDQPGPRIILFRVSGLIDAQIHLTHGDVTIAGQTSPGGITLRGFTTDEQPFQDQAVRRPQRFAQNWILQHVRLRPGADGPDGDGLRLRYTRNAIVDHVSIGNAVDEAVEISYSNAITLQRSILAETVGEHAFYGGVLLNYSNPAHGFALDRIALHHNLFHRIVGRLPESSRESRAAARSLLQLEVSNNLYWDPGFLMMLGTDTGVVTDAQGRAFPAWTQLNLVGNHFQTRAEFPFGMADDRILRDPAHARGNSVFVSGNSLSRTPRFKDLQLFYCCNDFATAGPGGGPILADRRSLRHPFPPIRYDRAEDLRRIMVAGAGAFPRDPMDLRLLRAVQAGRIDRIPRDRNPAGDALLMPFRGAAPPPPRDSDADGMPDAWEQARGLNPNRAGSAARTLSRRGYTDLEVYLHERAALLEAVPGL